jgi:hypothetical protein
MRGIFSFSNELFTSFNYFRKEGASRREQARDFDKYLLFGQGTVPWKQVDHPQYGKVEVGGQTKQWGRQPPSFLLEEECHRNMAFTLYHADQMPRVKIQSVEIEPLPGGLHQVTAAIVNEKLIPTHASVDVKNNITPPDIVSIDGKDLKVVLGIESSEPFFLDAKEQERQPERMRIRNVPGMGAIYVRWLVESQGPWTVAVQSVKGGSDRKRVDAAAPSEPSD